MATAIAWRKANRNIELWRPFQGMTHTPIEIETMIRIEADEAARRYGPSCFDLRCVMGSRGDTLSDTEVLEMLRCLNRRGSIFSSTFCRVR